MTTRAWHAVRDVAPEVQTLANALLNLRSTDPIGYCGTVPKSDRCQAFEGHGDLRSVVNVRDSKEPVLVSFFEDRTGQKYFMVVNLVHGKDMSKVDGVRTIRLTFDKGVASVERLNRLTGRVETLKTMATQSGSRFLNVQLEGGTGDLFKWSNGNAWALRPRSRKTPISQKASRNRIGLTGRPTPPYRLCNRPRM